MAVGTGVIVGAGVGVGMGVTVDNGVGKTIGVAVGRPESISLMRSLAVSSLEVVQATDNRAMLDSRHKATHLSKVIPLSNHISILSFRVCNSSLWVLHPRTLYLYDCQCELTWILGFPQDSKYSEPSL